MKLKKEQLDIIRQWFNSIEDTNQQYLNDVDYALYFKIMKDLNMRVSETTMKNAEIIDREKS